MAALVTRNAEPIKRNVTTLSALGFPEESAKRDFINRPE